MALSTTKRVALLIVGSLGLFLGRPHGLLGAGPDRPLPSLNPPVAVEVEPVDVGRWAAKTKGEMQREYDQMARDLDLMEKRLNRLRGTTRLNQDQYREREILETLVGGKRRELEALGRLIESAGRAPFFDLPSTQEESLSLEHYLGRQAVFVVFYGFDFSPDSTRTLSLLNEKKGLLTGRGAAIVAISADHPFSQKAFSETLGLSFPLLSDRSRRVIKAYGVYDEKRDAAREAYFLIDGKGRIVWSDMDAPGSPPLDAVTAILDRKE